MPIVPGLHHTSSNLLKRFLFEEDAAVLTEFALLLPGLLTMYLATIEFAKLDQFHSQVGKTASTVNDIVAKVPVLQADRIDAAMLAGESIAGAWSDRLRIEVRGVEINSGGTATVRWSRARNWVATAPGTVVNLPSEIARTPGFVVQTRTEFDFDWSLKTAFRFLPTKKIDYEFFNIPRASQGITCDDCNQ